MELIQHISKNENLVFIDAKDGNSFSLDQLLFPLTEINSIKKNLAFLYLDTGIISTALYLSFLKTNNTLVLLNNSLDQSLKLNLEEEYRPSVIFDKSRNAIEDYESIGVHSPSFKTILFKNERFYVEISQNCKVLLSTSGTTGSPKFVKLSENNLLENAKSIIDYLPINWQDVTPLNLPLHYSYGLSVLHSNAIAGGKIVCGLTDILQRDFWNQLNKFGFTSLAGVPYIYEMLHRIGFLEKSYPTLKYLTQAGGNLGENIKKIFYEYCQNNEIAFYIMYGQTEATARISFVPVDMLGKKITSIGKPIKNGRLFLDEETNELLYSGPNVFGGYAENMEDLARWEDIPVLRTGDLGILDEDGFFFIKGRLKRFVKIYGNRINLDEIEAYLKKVTTNGLLACIGINDDYILISHNEMQMDERALKKSVFGRFNIHPSAIKLQQLNSLPLTGNGKVNYKKIESDYFGY